MTRKEQYELDRQRIIDSLGKPVYGNGFETEDNESAKQLKQLKGKYLTDIRQDQKASREAEQPVIDVKELEASLSRLNGFEPLESDLKGFEGVERELLKLHLSQPELTHKELANKLGKSYQFVAGFLNRRNVQLLSDSYFVKNLKRNTKLGLLKLTKSGDARIVLAVSEALKTFGVDEKDTGSAPLVDPVAEERLKVLGDELADL